MPVLQFHRSAEPAALQEAERSHLPESFVDLPQVAEVGPQQLPCYHRRFAARPVAGMPQFNTPGNNF